MGWEPVAGTLLHKTTSQEVMQLADWVLITLTSAATLIGMIIIWGTAGFWFLLAV
jgi:hypothetical protein